MGRLPAEPAKRGAKPEAGAKPAAGATAALDGTWKREDGAIFRLCTDEDWLVVASIVQVLSDLGETRNARHLAPLLKHGHRKVWVRKSRDIGAVSRIAASVYRHRNNRK